MKKELVKAKIAENANYFQMSRLFTELTNEAGRYTPTARLSMNRERSGWVIRYEVYIPFGSNVGKGKAKRTIQNLREIAQNF